MCLRLLAPVNPRKVLARPTRKMKNKLVVFTKNNARVLVNPSFKEIKAYQPNSVLNPDLSKVKAVPTHLWKLKDGAIIPMSDHEAKMRESDIKLHGVDNTVRRLTRKAFDPSLPFYLMRQASTVLIFAGSAVFTYAAIQLLFPEKLVSFNNLVREFGQRLGIG